MTNITQIIIVVFAELVTMILRGLNTSSHRVQYLRQLDWMAFRHLSYSVSSDFHLKVAFQLFFVISAVSGEIQSLIIRRYRGKL